MSDLLNTIENGRDYPVRKHTNVFRYRITVPKSLFDTAGIENSNHLGVSISLRDESKLTLVYGTNVDNFSLKNTVSKHSSGEVTVPSALAASTRLNKCDINWKLEEYKDEFLLHGMTNKEINTFSSEEYTQLYERPLKHVKQNVDFEGEEWEQEHYQLYLDVEATEVVQWDNEERIVVTLASIDGKLGLLLAPLSKVKNKIPKKAVKVVRKTGDNQRDRLVYIPNDIVRCLQFIDTPLTYYGREKNRTLLAVPK